MLRGMLPHQRATTSLQIPSHVTASMLIFACPTILALDTTMLVWRNWHTHRT